MTMRGCRLWPVEQLATDRTDLTDREQEATEGTESLKPSSLFPLFPHVQKNPCHQWNPWLAPLSRKCLLRFKAEIRDRQVFPTGIGPARISLWRLDSRIAGRFSLREAFPFSAAVS
jgi:hypothetical protein